MARRCRPAGRRVKQAGRKFNPLVLSEIQNAGDMQRHILTCRDERLVYLATTIMAGPRRWRLLR
jgi:hypothetical protein